MSRAAPARRWLTACVLLMFVGLLVTPALSAFAEDEAPPKKGQAAAEPAADEALTEGDLLELLLEKPAALWAFGLARFVPVLIGIGLLIAAFVHWLERRREGVLVPPSAVVLTQPFDLGGAAAVWAAGFLLVPGVIIGVWGSGLETPLWLQIGAMAVGSVPAALLVVLRRQRMALQAADARAAGATAQSTELPLPTPAPRQGQALKLGLWTVCVALVFATPLAILWTLLLNAVTGEPPRLQGLVQLALDPDSTYEPWLIAGFGVLIAPFAEEALFRGMLYPALRSVLARVRGRGDTTPWVARRAMWVSAVAVSLLFAAVHGNALAMAPLFALAMVLTWIFEKTNSLAACVFAHAVHNALSMVPVLFLRTL